MSIVNIDGGSIIPISESRPMMSNSISFSISTINSSHLNSNIPSTSGVASLICETCHRSFRSPAGLSRHQMSHTNTFPFHCPTCGRGFHQSLHYNDHLAAHRGEKNYSCPNCGKLFSTMSNMQFHFRKCAPSVS